MKMARQTHLGRPLLKKDIEVAYQHSRSASAAARYLGVSYPTFKKYAELYGMFKINKSGVGIPRPKKKGAAGIEDILAGKRPNYPNKKLRLRIIRLGILPLKCELCGYDQVRMDGMPPLTLYFKDGDIHNKRLDNLELRCYNCMYITTGKVEKEVLHMPAQVFEHDVNWAMEVPFNWTEMQKEIQDEIEKETEERDEGSS